MRRLIVLALDSLLIVAAYFFAFLLRYDFQLSMINQRTFQQGLLVVLLCKPVVFASLGLYRSLWRYASLQDGIEILKAVSLGSVISFLAFLFFRLQDDLSRTVLLLDWLLLLGGMASSRLVWRIIREHHLIPNKKNGSRTLLIGAGEAGSMLLKEIRKQSKTDYQVVGFVDDDHAKRGMKLHGVSVLGGSEHLKTLIDRHRIEDVIIAMPSAPKAVVRGLLDCCMNAKVRVKTLPRIDLLIEGAVSVTQIKDVEIEDLLGREQVKLDEVSIAGYLSGKKVLVSGAGGSIGRELCRQAACFAPYKLILLDVAETPLYEIEYELAAKHPALRIVPVIADIRNKNRIEAIFDEFTPDVVFHAAAYKHVPMMEYNPCEAIANNCGGTRVLADAADAFGVKNFVMISTDKAVNPTNIMGASKRTAELYVQSLAVVSPTHFTTVRFGNVLGSNGSVIPLFKDQIRKGGPVTVTDKRIIRYFMTIPEAAQLVLQAGCLGVGGDIFVLDMGEPVRIVDLAEELIRLSGLTPHKDIEIIFTGLRPGEKLFEELLIDGEGIKKTSHEKIRVLSSVQIDRQDVVEQLNRLLAAAELSDISEVIRLLKKMVPELRLSYSCTDDSPFPLRRMRPDLFPVSEPSAQVITLKKTHKHKQVFVRPASL